MSEAKHPPSTPEGKAAIATAAASLSVSNLQQIALLKSINQRVVATSALEVDEQCWTCDRAKPRHWCHIFCTFSFMRVLLFFLVWFFNQVLDWNSAKHMDKLQTNCILLQHSLASTGWQDTLLDPPLHEIQNFKPHGQKISLPILNNPKSIFTFPSRFSLNPEEKKRKPSPKTQKQRRHLKSRCKPS